MLDDGEAIAGEHNAAAIGAAHLLPFHGLDIVESTLVRDPNMALFGSISTQESSP